MISLTQAASSEIKRLQSKQKLNLLFRLAVKHGGCSGWYYDMSFDETVRPGDRTFECNSIPIIIDAESCNYLNGSTLDYSEDLMGGGFRFYNPQASASCGCGNSFSIS
ncbi:iron-sulfur cluster assembly accessory protein [Chlorogloeopsis sp. ULAP01]|uniref:HesB/IscA family protein n=1 Tax=Chlorogloeopsis sp. ULAP01 TaxID=3056483 RepID=UPI0025AAE9B9|nr:iron-sulfur cluster assembly accessory protein [Chlorogloeopsis sp. ULAP01]MDM9380897.1 iron-sulfur cluster assembly accessory protein [Chlorogloeopsis sp. ULAP01]